MEQKVGNPRWWPLNFNYLFLSLCTRQQQNSDGGGQAKQQDKWQHYMIKLDETGSVKSKMVASKLELLIFQLIHNIATAIVKFPRAGNTTRLLRRLLFV